MEDCSRDPHDDEDVVVYDDDVAFDEEGILADGETMLDFCSGSSSSASFVSEHEKEILDEFTEDAAIANAPDVSVSSIRICDSNVYAVAVSPQCASDGSVCVVAAGTGSNSLALLAVYRRAETSPVLVPLQEFTNFPDTVACVAFSPDSRFLAACSYAQRDDDTGETTGSPVVRVYRLNGAALTAAAVNARLQQQAANDGGASEPGPAVAEEICCLDGPADDIEWVAWSPSCESHRLAAGCRDHSVWMWQRVGREWTFCRVIHAHSKRVTAGCWCRMAASGGNAADSAGGSDDDVLALCTASKDGRTVWTGGSSGRPLASQQGSGWHRHRVTALAAHSTRPLVASGASNGHIWIANAGRPIQSFTTLHSDNVEALAWNPPADSTSRVIPCLLLSGGLDGQVCVVDAATWSIAARFRHVDLAGNSSKAVGGVTSVDWLCINNNDQQFPVSAATDGTIRVWGERECRAVLTGHSDVVAAVRALPSRMGPLLVSAGFDGQVKLWSLEF